MVQKIGIGTTPMAKESATNDQSATATRSLHHRLLAAALCWREATRRHAKKKSNAAWSPAEVPATLLIDWGREKVGVQRVAQCAFILYPDNFALRHSIVALVPQFVLYAYVCVCIPRFSVVQVNPAFFKFMNLCLAVQYSRPLTEKQHYRLLYQASVRGDLEGDHTFVDSICLNAYM